MAAVGCLLFADGEAFQRLDVEELDLVAERQFDHALLLELRERAAHGLDGEAKKIANVGARHWQLKRCSGLAVAFGARGEGEKEARNALDGAPVAGRQHEIPRGGKFAR